MNPEVKTKWLAALRSGEYPQTTETLKDDKGFCCLGVLCDIHAALTYQAWIKTDPLGNGKTRWDYKGHRELPPIDVLKWAEIDNDVKLQYNHSEHHITSLNDTTRLTFNQIADLIEEQL